jgi:peptidyl-prolyl cis-trans isomerase B (cyclophilin B)
VKGDTDGEKKDLDLILAKKYPAALALAVAHMMIDVGRFDEARKLLAPKVKSSPEALAIDGLACYPLDEYETCIKELGDALKSREKIDPGIVGEAEALLEGATERLKFWTVEGEIRKREAAAKDLPTAVISTSKGDIEIELFENEAPNAVANFIVLAEAKFYDGLKFHRVIPNFMVQGGCPKGNGTGDPGYKFDDEFPENFRRHFRGTLAMANSGANTNGSQFFITHRPTEWLDGKHVVFGRVTKRLAVVDAIVGGDVLKSVTITRKRSHAYEVIKK